MLKKSCSVLLLLGFLFSFAHADEPVVLSEPVDSVCRVLGENRFVNDSSFFTIEKMANLTESFNTAIDALGENHPPVYLYFVESSRSHAIASTFDENSPGYNYLLENLHADAFDHLKYTTYAQFCDYFYSTDHHWNYKGSYQGYMDVVRLLLGEDEQVLVPADVVVCDLIFNGSYAKKRKEPISDEYFTFYRFDPFPSFSCYISQDNLKKDKRTNYSNFDKYIKGKIGNDLYANHYAQCYGGDVGFMIFKGEGPKDRVLLIIGNSLSNPVKTLLTAHYSTIVYVDLRHYKQKHGQDFSLGGAIKQYGVSQVLFLGDINLFINGDPMVP